MKNSEGKIAVVTGASSGVGHETARRLAKRGCAVALADIDRDGRKGLRLRPQRLPSDRKRRLRRRVSNSSNRVRSIPLRPPRGRVDILINNAGVVIAGTFEEQRLEDLEWLVGINYWGVVYGCHYFLPLLKQPEEAHIVNVSSMFGFLGLPEQSGYCASKAAVRALSESLWAKLRRDKIGVTSIHPGCIDTSIIQSSRIDDEESHANIRELFNLRGAPPDTVAVASLRGIEKNKLRVRVRPESVLSEWGKRLFPVGIHRMIARYWKRRRVTQRSETRTAK